MVTDYHIRKVHGHFEVYSPNGSFVVSADTYEEVIFELNVYLSEQL